MGVGQKSRKMPHANLKLKFSVDMLVQMWNLMEIYNLDMFSHLTILEHPWVKEGSKMAQNVYLPGKDNQKLKMFRDIFFLL